MVPIKGRAKVKLFESKVKKVKLFMHSRLLLRNSFMEKETTKKDKKTPC